MPGVPLSLLEREEISVALIADREVAWAVIARRVERHPTTIAREVAANGGRHGYRPAVADRRAARCLARPKPRRLAEPGWLRDRVTCELAAGRSPVAIWADLAAEAAVDPLVPVVCVETIYTTVYSRVLDVKPSECLRTRRPRRRRRGQRCPTPRLVLPSIAERPAVVNDRAEPGHWEADQIIGARNRSSMLWLTERVTRYSIGVGMPDGYDADATLAGLVHGFEQIPAHLRLSVTFDRGSEWACWETLAATYAMKAWFCDPHAPHQRGQIENLNRQWRWWFPRGINLALIAQTAINDVAGIVNGQRRRSLGYHSPTHLYTALTVQ
jgi:transposase, IS30 family